LHDHRQNSQHKATGNDHGTNCIPLSHH
jgi:hypothetical protein